MMDSLVAVELRYGSLCQVLGVIVFSLMTYRDYRRADGSVSKAQLGATVVATIGVSLELFLKITERNIFWYEHMIAFAVLKVSCSALFYLGFGFYFGQSWPRAKQTQQKRHGSA